MNDKRIRVAVHGYGVIGKRVADAVQLQPDMELVGVADALRLGCMGIGYTIYPGTSLRRHQYE